MTTPFSNGGAQMTDYQSLPPSVLAKIVQLDARCLTLNAGLDRARSEQQHLRKQLSQLVPNIVLTNITPIARPSASGSGKAASE